MKKVKFLMLASSMLLLCFAFTACGGDDNGNDTKTWTVKFFDGATEMKSVKVDDGETLAVADFPSTIKANHTFDGWFVEAAFTNLFVATTAITKNLNLYGKWTSTGGGKTWIVKFFDGATELVSLTVNDGEEVAPADIPSTTKADFEFDGWYTNEGLTTAWASNAKVTTDLNIYGKWNATGDQTWTVKFFDGVTEMKVLTVNHNATVASGDIPSTTKQNFTFDGWFTNSGLTTAWVSTTPVTADLNLYGKWSASVGGEKVPPVNLTWTFSTYEGMHTYEVSGDQWDLIENADSSSFVRIYYSYNPWDPEVVELTGWEESWGNVAEGYLNAVDYWVEVGTVNTPEKYVDYPHAVASLGHRFEWGGDWYYLGYLSIVWYYHQGPPLAIELHYGNCNCVSCN